MKVICWHQPVVELRAREPDWQELLVMWEESWRKRGFSPHIIGHSAARGHPLAAPVYSKAHSMPTSNARGYEVGCWVRWLAFAEIARRRRENVLACDSDVLNFGLEAERCKELKEDITFLDRDRVCCLVHLTPRGAERIVEEILGYQVAPGTQHTSDMIFFWERFSKRLPVPKGVQIGPEWCVDYDYLKGGAEETPLCVHFSAKGCEKGRTPKSKTAQRYSATGEFASR